MLLPNYTPNQLEDELLKAASECATKGELFVKAKSKYEEIEDGKKIKFAILLDESKETTMTAKEKDVLKSERWRNYIRMLTDARTSYLYAQMQYDTAIRNFDTCRSLLSSKNTERRTGI